LQAEGSTRPNTPEKSKTVTPEVLSPTLIARASVLKGNEHLVLAKFQENEKAAKDKAAKAKAAEEKAAKEKAAKAKAAEEKAAKEKAAKAKAAEEKAAKDKSAKASKEEAAKEAKAAVSSQGIISVKHSGLIVMSFMICYLCN
jgi:flagellar biosynthesis GTPase FlhF